MSLKRLLILFIALWLPASVVIAGTINVAMADKAGEAMQQMSSGCEQHPQESEPEPSAGDCHACSFCHFACTALMSESALTGALRPVWIAPDFSSAFSPPFIPDRLQRPPPALTA